MAIEKYGAELLALLKSEGLGLDRFLMLGRQHFFLRDKEATRIEELAGISVADLLRGDPDETYAEAFLQRLGIGRIDSMDFSDYQGCNIIHDMNQPVARDLEGKYDVVYDGGTLEHIFNFPVAIQNCMKMVRKGGYFLSCAPSNGYNGHGFYQFSPELFYNLFEGANGFEVKLMALVENVPGGAVYQVENPGKIGCRVGLNSGKPTFLIVAAKRQRTDAGVLEEWPGQSDYAATWKGAGEREHKGGEEERRLGFSFGASIRRLLPKALANWAKYSMAEKQRKKAGLAGLTRISRLEEAYLGGL